jgi:phytol kinase
LIEKWLIVNNWEISLVPFVIAAILALMALVRFFAGRFDVAPELQRKIIHVAVGLSALVFPLLFSSPVPVFLLTALAIAVMLNMRGKVTKTEGLGSVLHSVGRKSFGEIYLALSVAFLFFRSESQPVLYVLPLLVITLSDTASALVGTAYGRMRFLVEDGSKSYEGVIAFFMVTWICSMIVLLLLSDTARLNVVVISFLIAAFCALVEADSWRGLDNLLVPVGAHLLLSRHLNSDPVMLLIIAIIFTAALIAAIRCAGLLGLTRQAARSYAIMLFLTITVVHPVHAILPLATVVTHMAARKWNPSRSKTPDLDFLAAATGIGLIWLLAGESIGGTVLYLFGTTFVGAAIIFSVIAAKVNHAPFYIRYLPLPLSIVLFAVITMMQHNGAMWSDTHIPSWHVFSASCLLCAGLAIFFPTWFSSFRSPKVFLVAMIIPVILFVSEGVFR